MVGRFDKKYIVKLISVSKLASSSLNRSGRSWVVQMSLLISRHSDLYYLSRFAFEETVNLVTNFHRLLKKKTIEWLSFPASSKALSWRKVFWVLTFFLCKGWFSRLVIFFFPIYGVLPGSYFLLTSLAIISYLIILIWPWGPIILNIFCLDQLCHDVLLDGFCSWASLISPWLLPGA